MIVIKSNLHNFQEGLDLPHSLYHPGTKKQHLNVKSKNNTYISYLVCCTLHRTEYLCNKAFFIKAT